MTTTLGQDKHGHGAQVVRPSGTTQTVSISGTSAATTNPVDDGGATIVRIISTTACHYILGSSPTATTSHAYLPADTVEYIAVNPGDKIAFIQASASGTAYVTECS